MEVRRWEGTDAGFLTVKWFQPSSFFLSLFLSLFLSFFLSFFFLITNYDHSK